MSSAGMENNFREMTIYGQTSAFQTYIPKFQLKISQLHDALLLILCFSACSLLHDGYIIQAVE